MTMTIEYSTAFLQTAIYLWVTEILTGFNCGTIYNSTQHGSSTLTVPRNKTVEIEFNNLIEIELDNEKVDFNNDTLQIQDNKTCTSFVYRDLSLYYLPSSKIEVTCSCEGYRQPQACPVLAIESGVTEFNVYLNNTQTEVYICTRTIGFSVKDKWTNFPFNVDVLCYVPGEEFRDLQSFCIKKARHGERCNVNPDCEDFYTENCTESCADESCVSYCGAVDVLNPLPSASQDSGSTCGSENIGFLASGAAISLFLIFVGICFCRQRHRQRLQSSQSPSEAAVDQRLSTVPNLQIDSPPPYQETVNGTQVEDDVPPPTYSIAVAYEERMRKLEL